MYSGPKKLLLLYLALDVTAKCICEILCLALDGFDLNTAHKLSNKDKKNLGGAGIQTQGFWIGSKNASSVLRSFPLYLGQKILTTHPPSSFPWELLADGPDLRKESSLTRFKKKIDYSFSLRKSSTRLKQTVSPNNAQFCPLKALRKL